MKYVLIFGALAVLAAGRNIEPIVFTEDAYSCTASGSFPDPDDASKFYYCVAVGSGYLSTLISCESGYIFDTKSAQCVLTSQDQSSDGAAPLSTSTDAQPTVAASSAPLTASPSTPFPSSTEVTAIPSSTDSASTELPTSPSVAASLSTEIPVSTELPTTPSSAVSTKDNESPTSQNAESTETNSSAATTVAPFSCTGNGPFPDPASKQIYYYCFSAGDGEYIPVKLECGAGTQYMANIGSCGISGESETTPAGPDATSQPDKFKCPGAGLFPNPDDTTTFYYCLAGSDGSYIPFELGCGSGTQFLPALGGCGVETETTTQGSTDGIIFNCPSSGAFSDPKANNSFYFCFENGESGYIPLVLTCSSGMVFDAELNECVDTNDTTDVPTTIVPFTCPSEGVYADPSDATKFYYCFESPDGSGYRETVFTCPLGLVYSEDKKYCSVPEIASTTTDSSSSTEIASTTPSPYNCTRNGMFADPSSDEYFFICIFDGFGYISISFQCSPGMVFIPDLYRCAAPDTPVPPPAPVNCTSIGYYADPTNCQTYYYCYSNFDGGYLALKMECPDGTSFFPNMQICVSDTVYSCNDGSSSAPESSTAGETSTTTMIPTSTTAIPASTTTAKSTEFHCTTSGLFPFPGNQRRYYVCKVQKDGRTFVKVENCWLGEQFSPELGKCVFSFNWNSWW